MKRLVVISLVLFLSLNTFAADVMLKVDVIAHSEKHEIDQEQAKEQGWVKFVDGNRDIYKLEKVIDTENLPVLYYFGGFRIGVDGRGEFSVGMIHGSHGDQQAVLSSSSLTLPKNDQGKFTALSGLDFTFGGGENYAVGPWYYHAKVNISVAP